MLQAYRLRKLRAARLKTPSSPMVETKLMGLGMIAPTNNPQNLIQICGVNIHGTTSPSQTHGSWNLPED